MSSSPSFDDVRTTHERSHRSYCPRCNAHGPKPGVIRVMLNELVAGNRKQRSVANRSVSFCEPCGVEVYERLLDALVREGKQ